MEWWLKCCWCVQWTNAPSDWRIVDDMVSEYTHAHRQHSSDVCRSPVYSGTKSLTQFRDHTHTYFNGRKQMLDEHFDAWLMTGVFNMQLDTLCPQHFISFCTIQHLAWIVHVQTQLSVFGWSSLVSFISVVKIGTLGSLLYQMSQTSPCTTWKITDFSGN